MNRTKSHVICLVIAVLAMALISISYSNSQLVIQIHHNGDSISKLGQQDSIRAWLSRNYPNVTFISTINNNGGIIGNWSGSCWNWSWKYDSQIFLVNSGMWDRFYADSVFTNRMYDYWKKFKSLRPKTKVVWMSTTNVNPIKPNYSADSASIVSKNALAKVVLDSVYGAGNWYFVDNFKIQKDSNLVWADTVHPTTAGYAVLARNTCKYLDTAIRNYEVPSVPTVPKVAYAVCPGGPANIKTGSPTVTIGSDAVATFSVAQTDVLMGAGVGIKYNDGSPKWCYVAPAGKLSTTQWRVTTALGAKPSACSNATVDTMRHPFASLNAAFAGHIGAGYINSTNRTAWDGGANIEIHLPCYMEQTGRTVDGAATFSQSSGDFAHMIYIYGPTNIATECNQAMGVTYPRRDSTKYTISDVTNVLVKNTVAAFVDIQNIQIYMNRPNATTARNTMSINPSINFDYMRFSRNFIMSESPDATGAGTGEFRVFYFGTAGGGTYLIDNNVIVAPYNAGTNTGSALRVSVGGGSAFFYNNVVFGDFYSPVLQSAGNIYTSNNIYAGMASAGSAASSTYLKDYNVYDIDESETNGKLTTQNNSTLFTDTTKSSVYYWDYTPPKGSDAVDAGISLDPIYAGDISHSHSTLLRQGRSRWDCGVVDVNYSTKIKNKSRWIGKNSYRKSNYRFN